MLWRGRVVVITGASSGIGLALALELAGRGARIVLAARDGGRLEETAEACRARGAEAHVVPTDVTVEEEARRLVEETVTRCGRLDVLVNNAGTGMITAFEAVRDLSLFERVMRVNYLGAVYATWHALPHLRRTGGRIAVVSSLAGLGGVPTRTGYAASKHALMGFFDSLRIELHGSGVSVTVVCPDFVVSEIQKRAFGADGAPLGRNPLDESRIMSAAECARLTARAIERRQRLAILSWRGRLARWLRLVAPGLVDTMTRRAIERSHRYLAEPGPRVRSGPSARPGTRM